jgi:hypothetical protein
MNPWRALDRSVLARRIAELDAIARRDEAQRWKHVPLVLDLAAPREDFARACATVIREAVRVPSEPLPMPCLGVGPRCGRDPFGDEAVT